VDTNGGSCTRQSTAGAYNDAQACGSFDAAYRAASAGDLVLVRAGTYGGQQINTPNKGSETSRITFAPYSGAAVTLGQTDVYAAHVTVRDMKTAWYVRPGASDVDLINLDDDGWYAVRGASDVQIIGGDVGPGKDVTPQVTSSTGVLFDGVTFHDWIKTTEGAHVDCLGVFGGSTNVTVRNSKFKNCMHFDVLVDNSVDTALNANVVFENNVMEKTTGGYYSVFVTKCKTCSVAYNTLLQAPAVDSLAGSVSGLTVYGTIMSDINSSFCSLGTYRYNVYAGSSTCGGAGERTGDPRYRNAAGGDYRLSSGSSAIQAGDPTKSPTSDIDGTLRPSGTTADAGAYRFIS
jgi:hypothetical protein